MKQVFTLLLTFLSLSQLMAQVSFVNGNDKLVTSDNHTGLSIAVCDMNNDNLDDIVRLLNGKKLCIELQQIDGTFTRQEFQEVSYMNAWTLSVADIDNNGFADIMTGGSYDDMKVYMANDLGTDYEGIIMPGPQMFAQGSNLVDINNDGHLDAFVCHDDAESRIWANDEMGGLVMADDWIDMTTTPNSDNSGNYGSVWTDFDQDGDVDLYIAKCRQFEDNANSPLRLNALFVNDGNGNFTDEAEARGLKIGRQSWAVDFGDIDNDGDFDCFLVNHGSQSQILENDGTGHFTDISDAAGIPSFDFAVQSMMRDMDNDGFLDLLVSGSGQYYYHNNGDKTFTKVDEFIPQNNGSNLYSFSLGDLNHDGFVDINGGYGSIYTQPSSRDDILWLNEANDNHWIALDLEGTTSNRSAVGTKAIIYGDWGVQIREVRAGESYGISNSLALHFGIGANTTIDSIVIDWPSGNQDVILNPAIDQYLNVVEKECIVGGVFIEANGPTVFCAGSSVTLTAPAGFSSYDWSEGSTSESIVVTESGGYRVTVINEDCSVSSNIILVHVNPDETPIILEGTKADICPGESLALNAEVEEIDGISWNGDFSWSNGGVLQSTEVTTAGSYTVDYEGLCATFTSAPIDVEVLVVDPLVTAGVVIAQGESAQLVSDGVNPEWYDVPEGGTPIATGAVYNTAPLNVTTSFYVEAQQEFVGVSQQTGLLNIPTEGFFTNEQSGLRFELAVNAMLNSVKVNAQEAGVVTIGVFDFGTSSIIQQKTVSVVEGEQTVELNFTLGASDNLVLFQDGDSGSANLFIATNDSDFSYPFEIQNVVSITSNVFGSIETYASFYALEFQPAAGKLCDTDRQEVVATVLEVSVAEVLDQERINIFPNPVINSMTFQSTDEQAYDLIIFDAIGQIVQTKKAIRDGEMINMANWNSGAYFMKVSSEEGLIAIKRIAKI